MDFPRTPSSCCHPRRPRNPNRHTHTKPCPKARTPGAVLRRLTYCDCYRICIQGYHRRQHHGHRRPWKGLWGNPVAEEGPSTSFGLLLSTLARSRHALLNRYTGQADRSCLGVAHLPNIPLSRLCHDGLHRRRQSLRPTRTGRGRRVQIQVRL